MSKTKTKKKTKKKTKTKTKTWCCGGNPGPAVSSNGCRFRYELDVKRANPETSTCPRCGHVDPLFPKR